MQYKKAIFCGFAAVVMAAVAAGPVVSNVTAKQRFPWNGLVDIACEVSGINGTTNGIEFAVAAVMPDSGNARYVSNFWIVRNGTNSFDKEIHVNGNYRLLWDAQSDLGAVICSNMVVRVTTIKVHGKVQLWRDGPYWATMNIGADKLEEHGWYFWWGDTVGYKFENGVWVASDGSSSDFSFNSVNVPTSGKSISTLESEGWVTADGVLAPEHDAAHVQWGGGWRIPTSQELSDLTSKCDWSWTVINGVEGCLVSGKGDYSSSSIFLPAAGEGSGSSLSNVGSDGLYWSSVPASDYTGFGSWYLRFFSGYLNMNYYYRSIGQAVRPVQGFVQLVTYNKVTYNPGEKGTGSQQVDTKVHGVALTLKDAIFTRAGCTQTGWSTSDGGAKAYDLCASYTVDADLALYPFWTAHTYMVTLDRQSGGGGTTSVTATYGSAMPSITVPTRTGYTFGGYYTGANGSGTQYYTASGASARTWDKASATMLYAEWIANTYTVTLYCHSGDGGTASVMATYGSAMPSIAVPTRTGYTFGGYYTDVNGSGTQYYTASGASARTWDKTSAMTLYAKWIANTYMVTLDHQSGGGGSTSVTATYGDEMPSIAVPTKAGYTFGGYYTGVNGSGTQYYTAYGASARTWDKASATTLYAEWTVLSNKVQLWKDGPYWATTNIGAEEPWEFGYYFWWGDTIGYKFENGVWVASDGSLANFSFDSGNVPTYGKSSTALMSKGWITADNALVPEHDAAYVHLGEEWRMPTGQELSDLKSKCDWSWTTVNGVAGYMVSGKGDYSSSSIFLPAGGYGYGTSLINVGSNGGFWASIPQSGSNYYDSWNLDFNLNYYSASEVRSRYYGRNVRPVQGVTQLVTYNPGENGTGSQQVDTKVHGVALALKDAIFTRAGCTQTGWSTSDGGAKVYDLGASYTVDADLALYPFWTAHTYTVTLDRQSGGGGTASVTATYGSAMPSITVPTKADCIFGGYYTGANGSGTQYYTASGASARTWDKTSATTLYAKWTTPGKVQLWEGGPYWATMNIGAEEPWEYGHYFWWGDTIGYKFENGAWTASDGSSSDFSFDSGNAPTSGKSISTLKSEEWITADNVLAPEHDVVHMQWGGAWRMSTDQELQDLNSKCDWSWTMTNGVAGYLVSGKGDYSSKSIFLPAAGYGDGTLLSNAGSYGYYWSSAPYINIDYYSWRLGFTSGYNDHVTRGYDRTKGLTVRPVQGAPQQVTYNPGKSGIGSQQTDTKTPGVALTLKGAIFTHPGCTQTGWAKSDGGAKAYDLGASYTLDAPLTLYPFWSVDPVVDENGKVQLWEGGPYWATTNIGAAEPWEYGYYFWWGDTIGYKFENGAWVASDGSSPNFSFKSGMVPTYGKSISALKGQGWITADSVLVPAHDAAHVHWGEEWRMPTDQELSDLNSKCNWTWADMNGVVGYLVSGKGDYSSKSIFLPAAGCGDGTLLSNAGSYGYYWSSVPNPYDDVYYSWYLSFYSSRHSTQGYYIYRLYGQTVRPVQGGTN